MSEPSKVAREIAEKLAEDYAAHSYYCLLPNIGVGPCTCAVQREAVAEIQRAIEQAVEQARAEERERMWISLRADAEVFATSGDHAIAVLLEEIADGLRARGEAGDAQK